MNYVFYDFETTGTSTRYDQFHQLGAILTNSDFKELQRFEIRCRLAPHIIPGPKADIRGSLQLLKFLCGKTV